MPQLNIDVDNSLSRAAHAIRSADRVVVVTGAGMSRESGIPTFREASTGLWARYDPEQLATESGFRQAPARVFGWYAWRRRLVGQAVPHAGYHALVALEARVPESLIVTQNVDGLHTRAGSRRVVELHGSLHRYSCVDHRHPFPVADLPAMDGDGDLAPPVCGTCGSLVRPDVVWFGEMLPEIAVQAAWDAAAACQVMLVVGTSGLVHPAARLPYIARDGGATVVEINPEPTDITNAAHVICRGAAGVMLPGLLIRLREETSS